MWQIELMLHVTWCSRKIRTAPPHSSPLSAPAQVPVMVQPSSVGIASVASTGTRVVPVDPLVEPRGREIGGEALLVGLADIAEQPSDVRMDEALEHPAPAFLCGEVGAVRIALLVGVGVVLAMVGHPLQR